VIIGNTVLTCGMRQIHPKLSYRKIFYMLLNHEIGFPKTQELPEALPTSPGPPTRALPWTRWGPSLFPDSSPILRPLLSWIHSGFDTGARSHPQHDTISFVSYEATEWDGPSDETGKTEVPCYSRCSAVKIPPCSKALSAEHGSLILCPRPYDIGFI
jgi:hypothetical protein